MSRAVRVCGFLDDAYSLPYTSLFRFPYRILTVKLVILTKRYTDPAQPISSAIGLHPLTPHQEMYPGSEAGFGIRALRQRGCCRTWTAALESHSSQEGFCQELRAPSHLSSPMPFSVKSEVPRPVNQTLNPKPRKALLLSKPKRSLLLLRKAGTGTRVSAV